MTNSRLGNEIGSQLTAHPGQSGIIALIEGIDALAARLGLALYAEKSLDVQYYIWRGDTSGVALGAALLQAADRGVRVRLLLDDLQASVHDPVLLVLHKHPCIEIRMFNPTRTRGFKAFELLSRFAQLNRRMHNKSLIADNQVAIVGGRNIGNEYFDASPEVNFTDFDVLAIGPVVQEVSSIFDRYWQSELAIPITSLLKGKIASRRDLERVRRRLAERWEALGTTKYAQALRNSEFVRNISKHREHFFWGRAMAVADRPNKFVTDPGDVADHMGPHLAPLLETIQSELLIVSPYFIPGATLVGIFADLVRRGVRVTILTNSLASNDVGLVHAGYAKYRKTLLAAGVALYEYKPEPRKIRRGKKRGSGFPGSSRASLHAKVFVLDRSQVFVGSMNLDPRSIRLNSELGVIFENPDFAAGLVSQVESELGENSYRVHIHRENEDLEGTELVWETIEQGQPVTYTSEPNVGIFRKIGVWFMSLFVSEELL